MGKSTRMKQLDKIPKFTGEKKSDIIVNLISSIQTNDFFGFTNILNHIRLWSWSKIIVKVKRTFHAVLLPGLTSCFVDILATIVNPGLTRLQTGQNMFQTGRKEEKERQTYRFFSGWSESFYILLFKRLTIAETSLRIDAVWSALLLFAHK